MAKEWHIEPSAIPDNAEINQYEKWDSLGHISIMMALEVEFGIEINADNVQNLLSITKILKYIENNKGAN